MQTDDDRGASKPDGRDWTMLFLVAFGIGLLGFLMVVDRQNWFQLRPASGTAAAMAYAAERGEPAK